MPVELVVVVRVGVSVPDKVLVPVAVSVVVVVEEVVAEPVPVPVAGPVRVAERLAVPVGVKVDEGVIDGVAEPSHTSPMPHTAAGLPQIKEPLKPEKVAAAPSVEHVAVAPEARVTV